MTSESPQSVSIAVNGVRCVSGLVQAPKRARACYVLAHGAGAGMAHPFMEAIADGLAERSVATLLLLIEDHKKFLPFVLPLFESDNDKVRWMAANAFASWGFPGALEPLTKLAREDKNGNVRDQAIAALGKCGSGGTLEVLRGFFDSPDVDENGRPLSKTALMAAESIQRRLASGLDFQELIYEMWYPDWSRQEPARARYRRLDRELRHAELLKILQTDQDGLIWRAIYLLLSEDHQKFLPLILPLFESNHAGVRQATAKVFGSARFPGAIGPLTKLAREDKDGNVRHAAVYALGKCGTAETIEVIRELFNSTAEDYEGRPLSEAAIEAANALQKRLCSGTE